MQRRDFLMGGLALPFAGAWATPFAAWAADAALVAPGAFDAATVPGLARALAAKPWLPPPAALPDALAKLTYDQYRDYRYRPAKALWHERGPGFQVQCFHRGFLFKDRVDIATVADGRATPFAFSTSLFDYTPQPVPKVDGDIGFAGFRLHAPLNAPGVQDEVGVFLGASYFRAVARGLQYGLSARGLALGTGEPSPEEFPVFRAFWLETPAKGAKDVVVHALLDSRSVAGAFRFRIVPGEETVYDVDARLYPRVALALAGIAPLTSMFDFDASDRLGVDDYRPAVHDSDGLALFNGQGEQAWRQLQNPKQLQHSGFQDANPKGFGLLQRKRARADFLDAEAHYERRPSLWIEPLDPWGKGEVHLVEIPTADEYHDNIVAFWRPAAPLAPGREHRFRYRMHWCRDHAWLPALATVRATRIGRTTTAGGRLVVIDLAGGGLDRLGADAKPRADIAASQGELRNPVAYRDDDGGWRMSFELVPGQASAVELRAVLRAPDGAALSETWLYRWTA